MRIDFNEQQERRSPGMNGGTGEMSDDINYVISGGGMAICDGKEELLAAGVCHICKRGSQHSIINTKSEDLVLLTVVVER